MGGFNGEEGKGKEGRIVRSREDEDENRSLPS